MADSGSLAAVAVVATVTRRSSPQSEQRRQADHADGAIHEVLDVERVPIGRQGQSLRRAADVEAQQLGPADRVDQGHLAAGLQGDEQVDAARMKTAALATPELSRSMRRA